MSYQPVPPNSPEPRRKRLSAWWFAVPAACLIGILATFAWFGYSMHEMFSGGTSVAVDGRERTVTVASTGTRTVFVDQHATTPQCEFTDEDSGEALRLHRYAGSFTRSSSAGDFRAAWNIEATSTRLLVRCEPTETGASTRIMIMPEVKAGRFVGGILGVILIPLMLGLIGVTSLVVLIIMRRTSPQPLIVPPST